MNKRSPSLVLNTIVLFTKVAYQNKERPLCNPLRGNSPLAGNNLFAACYRDVGKKKLLKTINL